jgi:hypothetical protein
LKIIDKSDNAMELTLECDECGTNTAHEQDPLEDLMVCTICGAEQEISQAVEEALEFQAQPAVMYEEVD